MGVVTAFGMAGQGGPSYEQFSHLYSITKSKSRDQGGWVQANCLRAAERGHFISHVPTSQKTWRKRRVLLSGDWESPSGHPVRFHIPRTFQIAGKLKQPVATRAELRQIDQVRGKVPAVDRVYPQLLFTQNLIKAQLVNPDESKPVPTAAEGIDVDDQSLSERLRQLGKDSAPPRSAAAVPSPGSGVLSEGTPARAASKRPHTVDLEADPAPKRGRQADAARAILAAEDDDAPADPVTLACPPKTVQ
ncbi:unnamed protein product, partial [Prunus brigantina]